MTRKMSDLRVIIANHAHTNMHMHKSVAHFIASHFYSFHIRTKKGIEDGNVSLKKATLITKQRKN